MFWVALSALIMSLTGEGDDTYAFRKILERGRDAVEEKVQDASRRQAAVKVLDRASSAFTRHRERTAKISACIERADRSYVITEADYERCLSDLGPAWDAAGESLIELDHALRSSLTPAELGAVRRAAEE
jgi:hypothetical protein